MATNLKKNIMRRIYFIWFLRALTHPFTLKGIAVAVLLAKASSYVSFGEVARNWPLEHGLTANYGFIESAVTHTESGTLLLLVLIGILGLWLIRDIGFSHLYSRKEAQA